MSKTYMQKQVGIFMSVTKCPSRLTPSDDDRVRNDSTYTIRKVSIRLVRTCAPLRMHAIYNVRTTACVTLVGKKSSRQIYNFRKIKFDLEKYRGFCSTWQT